MRRRRYVLTIELTTDDAQAAARVRTAAKRFAGALDPDTAVKVTRQDVDYPIISQPVVLMERALEP